MHKCQNVSQSQSKASNWQVLKRTYREVDDINDDDVLNITNERRRLNNNNIETDKLNEHKHNMNKYKKENETLKEKVKSLEEEKKVLSRNIISLKQKIDSMEETTTCKMLNLSCF